MEKFQFQAESQKLLDLMIHSIYTNKEIFLRELISNASDALDKFRFECITKPDLASENEKPEIRLEADKEKRILTIIDNGIGMSHDDLVSHIGTIAKSGTQEFLKKFQENKNDTGISELIGQFGVGFYSAFMAADKVTILTKKAGEDKAYQWSSTGDGEYTIEEASRESHGSTVTLYLKPSDTENGLDDFSESWVVQRVVKKYSDFISYPIVMKEEREEVEKDADGKPKKDGKKTTIIEDKTLNSMKPIWQRNASEVTEDEYKEFYKHISHDWVEPLKTVTYRAEGSSEFAALLYIPAKAPFDFYYRDHKSGLQLYVKKVMIMEAFEDLLPKYLRFMKGVVESSDLSLNISREMLQQDRHVAQMKKSLTKKVLDTLTDIMEKEREKYLEFWKEFGPAIKEGVTGDFENREKLLPLMVFQSSSDPEKLTSLDEYIARMKEGQDTIYYINGETRAIAENSPHLEALKNKGYEVLFLLEPIDEIVTQYVNEYKGKKLKSASKGDLDLGDKKEKEKTEKELKKKTGEFENLLKFIQEKLSSNVKEVKLSSRLVSAPACVVGADFDMSPYLEKLLQKEKQGGPSVKRTLELNPEHPVVVKMNERFQADAADPVLGDYAELLFDYAVLSDGGTLPDPVKFNKLVVELMAKNI